MKTTVHSSAAYSNVTSTALYIKETIFHLNNCQVEVINEAAFSSVERKVEI